MTAPIPFPLTQLVGARLRPVVTLVYVALLHQLDFGEYRVVRIPEAATLTGLSDSSVADAILTLTRTGFLDRRAGTAPYRYRLLTSRRGGSTTVDSVTGGSAA